MKKKYDIVFLMNHYGFYKDNLYNMLNKELSVFVIYLGEASIIRNKDFFKGSPEYDYVLLTKGDFEKRSRLKNCKKIISVLNEIEYSLLVTMAWSTPEDIVAAIISKRSKNAFICESSIFESKINGIKGVFKRVLLKRYSYAFVSGTPHKSLITSLKFKGEIIITGGVGIINRSDKIKKSRSEIIRYITVARLSPEKNLEFLINVFNDLMRPLTIIGKGPLSENLKNIAKSNITFIEEVNNADLNKIYSQFDVFILPSSSEPWGLVIDEAIYYGLPVIVSNKVGCRYDLVERYNTGLVFDYTDKTDLIKKINMMERDYEYYSNNVSSLDFDYLINSQLESYYAIVNKLK